MRKIATKSRQATHQPKARIKGAIVTPDFALRLMEHIGPTAAAKEIGTTPGTLHKARNARAITQSLEVAARGVWLEHGYGAMEQAQAEPPAPRTQDLGSAVHAPTSNHVVVMLVEVPQGREEIIKKTVAAIGGTIYVQA